MTAAPARSAGVRLTALERTPPLLRRAALHIRRCERPRDRVPAHSRGPRARLRALPRLSPLAAAVSGDDPEHAPDPRERNDAGDRGRPREVGPRAQPADDP